jgi:chromosome segregation ATPase
MVTENENLKSQVSELQWELDEKTSSAQASSESDAQIALLTSQLSELHQKHADMVTENENLKSQVSELQWELDEKTSSAQSSSESDAQIAFLTSQLSELHQKHADMVTENENLKSQVLTAVTTENILRKDIQAIQDNCLSLETSLKSEQDRSRSLANQVLNMQNKIEELSQFKIENVAMREELSRLEKEYQTQSNSKSALTQQFEEEIQILQKQLKDSKGNEEILLNTKASLNMELSGLRSQIDENNKRITFLQSSILTLESNIAQLQLENNAHKTQLAKTEEDKVHLHEQIVVEKRHYQTELSALQQKYQDVSKLLNNKENEISKMVEERTLNEKRVNDLTNSMNSMRANNDIELNSKISELTSELNELKNERDSIRLLLSTSESKLKSFEAKRQKDLDSLKRQNESIAQMQKEHRESLTQAEIEIANLNEKLTLNQQTNAELSSNKSLIDGLMEENSELKEKLRESLSKLENLESVNKISARFDRTQDGFENISPTSLSDGASNSSYEVLNSAEIVSSINLRRVNSQKSDMEFDNNAKLNEEIFLMTEKVSYILVAYIFSCIVLKYVMLYVLV